MNDKTIHQSLLELEENLKSLESARSQVVKVTASSERVIEAFTPILAQLEHLSEGINANKEEVLDAFNKVIKKMNYSLDEDSKNRIINNGRLQNNITGAVEKTILKLENCNVAIDGMVAKMDELNFEKAFSQIDIQQAAIIKNQNSTSKELVTSTIDIKNQINITLGIIEKTSKRNLIVLIAGIILILTAIIIF